MKLRLIDESMYRAVIEMLRVFRSRDPEYSEAISLLITELSIMPDLFDEMFEFQFGDVHESTRRTVYSWDELLDSCGIDPPLDSPQ